MVRRVVRQIGLHAFASPDSINKNTSGWEANYTFPISYLIGNPGFLKSGLGSNPFFGSLGSARSGVCIEEVGEILHDGAA